MVLGEADCRMVPGNLQHWCTFQRPRALEKSIDVLWNLLPNAKHLPSCIFR
jgi:hypothetical protein